MFGNEKLTAKKSRLQEKRTRLDAQEKLLRLKMRKARTRFLIEIGALFQKAFLKFSDTAHLQTLTKATLFGFFLDSCEKFQNADSVMKWKEMGSADLLKEKQEQGESLIISFENEPSDETKNSLKSKRFIYVPHKQEWYGRGNKDVIEKLLEKENPNITIVKSRSKLS
jgi:hypothetical protein